MADQISLTAQEGNHLLADCFRVVVPAKIEGVGSWEPATRANITSNIRQLKKALAEVSPIFRKERKTHFGPEEWYEKQERSVSSTQKEREIDETGEPVRFRWVVKSEARGEAVPVTLSGQAKKGLYVLLLLRLHPGPCTNTGQPQEFTQALTAGFQDEIIWPIAAKLGVVKDLEKKIGIGQGSEIAFEYDDAAPAKDSEKATA